MRFSVHPLLFQFYIVVSLILLSGLTTSENVDEDNEKICDTAQGKLLGSILKSRGGRNFYSFRGIPYAEKPERFQPSKMGKKWEGVKIAKEYGMECAQFFGTQEYIGSEDCLFLNVYSPNLNPDAKLNVMVWIHGGGHQFGSANDYSPEYLMDEDVVLVTINYRLGVLGYFSTGDDVVPGNNGMKDQVLALKWVKKHISNFGGSPDKVTIFGESAGGASVSFHVLSQLSKGLFQNAIAMSGSALNRGPNQEKPAQNARNFGERLNCGGLTKEMVDCLKNQDLKSIMQAQNEIMEWYLYPLSTFSVVVESKSNKESFLTDTPYKIMKEGSFSKVPYMTGITSDEGVFFTAAGLFDEDLKTKMNEDFKHFAPLALEYYDIETKDTISEKLLKFYADGQPFERSTWDKYNEMFADVWINYAVVSTANALAKHTKVYPYVFSYEGNQDSIINVYMGVPGFYGVTHADELMYLFKQPFGLPYFEKNSEVGKFSIEFVKSFVEFARTGVAKPWGKEKTWEPIKKNPKKNIWYSINAETGLEDIDKKLGRSLKFLETIFPFDGASLRDKESKTEL